MKKPLIVPFTVAELTIQERIAKIMEFNFIDNVSDLAYTLRYKDDRYLRALLEENLCSLDIELYERIRLRFPKISEIWLKLGIGPMLNE